MTPAMRMDEIAASVDGRVEAAALANGIPTAEQSLSGTDGREGPAQELDEVGAASQPPTAVLAVGGGGPSAERANQGVVWTQPVDRPLITAFLTETHGRVADHWMGAFLAITRRTLTADSVPRLIEETCACMTPAPNEHVYVMPAIFRRPPERRGTRREVGGLVGYVLDLDVTSPERRSRRRYFASVEAAQAALQGMPPWLQPSLTVHSGGGLQLWYLFREPLYFDEPDAAAPAEERWQRLHRTMERLLAVEIDPPNLVQPYRIPGTWNGKYTPPRPVTVVHWAGPRLDPVDLDDVLDVLPGSVSTPPTRLRPNVTLPTDLPAVDVLTLRVSRRIRRLIVMGEPQGGVRYASRSEMIFAVVTAMIAAGYDDTSIAGVLLDPRHPVSAKPRAQGRTWVAGEITRARAKHAAGAQRDRGARVPNGEAPRVGLAAMRCTPARDLAQMTTTPTGETWPL